MKLDERVLLGRLYERAERVGIRRVFRGLEADPHVALGGQIVNLARLRVLDDSDQIGRIGHVAEVHEEPHIREMRVPVQVVNPAGIERRGTALDAVYLVALLEEQFGQIGAVLPGHSCDQCCLSSHATRLILIFIGANLQARIPKKSR